MNAKHLYHFASFVTATLALFSPPPIIIEQGTYIVCLENSIIRGADLVACNLVNKTICDYQQDEIYVYSTECMSLIVPIVANITKNTEELRIFFTDPRNWSISMIILALNILGMVSYSLYKYCQRRKKQDEEELTSLTMQHWVRDSQTGTYSIQTSDSTSTSINVENPLMTSSINDTIDI